jgi:hypothetical protein
MPAAAFAGESLHPSLAEQAAAYLFHLVRNHPFVDGNKRVGSGVRPGLPSSLERHPHPPATTSSSIS